MQSTQSSEGGCGGGEGGDIQSMQSSEGVCGGGEGGHAVHVAL